MSLRVLRNFVSFACTFVVAYGEEVVASLEFGTTFKPAVKAPHEDGEEAHSKPSVRQRVFPQLVDVHSGEDAASAAQRVAEANGVFHAPTVLDITRHFAEQLKGVKYNPPATLALKSGGAYTRRSDEALKGKRFGDAASDCLRALLRPGLDSTGQEKILKKLDHVLWRLEKLLEMQAQETGGDDKYAEQSAEADALAKEWKVILAEDSQRWQNVDHMVSSSTSQVRGPEVAGINLTSTSTGGSTATEEILRASVHEGEDASHAAVHFCAANDIPSAEQLLKLNAQLVKSLESEAAHYEAPHHFKLSSPADYLRRGQRHAEDFDIGAAAADYTRGLQSANLTNEEKEELSSHLSSALTVLSGSQAFWAAWQARQFKLAIETALKFQSASRPDRLQLIISRCHAHLGNMKQAMASITGLLSRCDQSGGWVDDQPRLLAATSGAMLALQVGDVDKAKKMYQLVLRADPEQKYVDTRYKVLKRFTKMLSDIEDLTSKSKNHDVMKAVLRANHVLESVMGKSGAKAAGTRLLLFECKAKSAMTFHDDAIEACNTAIAQFENHDNPDPRKIAEAYAWRAEAEIRDRSYDDAVADLQVSLKKVPNSQEYAEKLEEAKRKQNEWNKSEEEHDRRTRQSLGHFYVKRPVQELLDLPDNIDELDKEQKCDRLKKAFRKMSLRWHPDKAKGGKKRAQRKSAELSEAKSRLEIKWKCKGQHR